MIDASRFFLNPWIGRGKAIAVAGVTSPKQDKYLEAGRRLLETCVGHYEANAQPQPALGALYVGALGPLVYLRWRLSIALREKEPNESDRLINQATSAVERYLQDTATCEYDRKRRVTLLEGSYFGARSLYAALLFGAGHVDRAMEQACGVINALRDSCLHLRADENEVLYGRAGALTIILFLRRELHDETIGSELALQLVHKILREGMASAHAKPEFGLPLVWKWHDSYYLGAAHGMVGILQTILSLNATEIRQLGSHLQLIRDTIDCLERFCFTMGNLNISITDSPRVDRLVHWCHGAPGHVLLLLKASDVFQDDKYRVEAKRMATDVIWTRGLLRKGVGLCHGISGSAYALLAVGRIDDSFRSMAEWFAEFALDKLDELAQIPDRPFSLFEGMGGLCSLAIDLSMPRSDQVRFPLYEF